MRILAAVAAFAVCATACFADSLKKGGTSVELHVFAGAPHGFGVRGSGPEKVWPDLAVRWLKAVRMLP